MIICIPGATSTQLSLHDLALEDAATYTCEVTDEVPLTRASNDAVLVVADGVRVSITKHPIGATKYLGEAHTFSVEAADGIGELHYQWQQDGVDVADATDADYTIDDIALADAGVYVCAVSDDYATALSAGAVLVVINQYPVPASAVVALGLLALAGCASTQPTHPSRPAAPAASWV